MGSKETGKEANLMVQERDDGGFEQGGSCVSSKKWSHLGFFWVTFGPEGFGCGVEGACARMRTMTGL